MRAPTPYPINKPPVPANKPTFNSISYYDDDDDDDDYYNDDDYNTMTSSEVL